MMRNVGSATVGAALLAALGGCAYQDTLTLPDLGPRHGSSVSVQSYPSSGYGYGYGNQYGYGYGNPYAYQSGYGYYGYGDSYYAQGGYPYRYNQYPHYIVVPCADANSDGRCDKKPPKHRPDRDDDDNDNDGQGQDGNHQGGNRPPRPRDDRPGEPPRWIRGDGDRSDRFDNDPRVSPTPSPALVRPVPVPTAPRAQPSQPRPGFVQPDQRRAVPPPAPTTERGGARMGAGRSSPSPDVRSPVRTPADP